MLGRWEWIILEVGFLGLLVWELARTRSAIRKAKKVLPTPETVSLTEGEATASRPGKGGA